MTRCLLFLALLTFFSCSKNADETALSPLVGRWTLVAQRDSAGAWTNFIPLVPVQFEFRADGTFDYLDAAGKPQRQCCQPSQYRIEHGATCPTCYCLHCVFDRVVFEQVVACPSVRCAAPPGWVIVQRGAQFLDLNLSGDLNPNYFFRYQRIR